MIKLWRNKVFQVFVYVLITVLFTLAASKLNTLRLMLEYKNTIIDKELLAILVKDIKFIKIVGSIVYMIAIGFYTVFIYSINHEKNNNEHEQ